MHKWGARWKKKKQMAKWTNEQMIGWPRTNLVRRSKAAAGSGTEGSDVARFAQKQRETLEKVSLHARTVESEDEGRKCFKDRRARRSAAAGPGTSQIYLLADGECGKLEWRQEKGSRIKNNEKMENRKRTQS